MNLPEHLRAVLALDPAAPAVEAGGRWSSWADLARVGDQLDAILADAGLGTGAPIACVASTRPEHVATMLGLWATRRTVVTVHPVQGDASLADDLEALTPPAVVADTATWERPGLLEVVERLEAVAVEVGVDPPGARRRTPRRRPGDRSRAQVPPDTAVLMSTSGTTGPPKRIPLGTASLAHALEGARHYESDKPRLRLSSGVQIVTAPLVHISGIWAVATAAVAGRRMALLERFRVEDWLDLVRRHRPRAASLVPAALAMVLASDADPADLASLQVVTCGTAPLDPDTADAFEARFGVPVLTLYGATEFAGGVAGWTLADHRRFAATKRGSVGRAHPGCDLRVVDPDTGRVLDAGTTGVLEVRARQLGDTGWVRTTDLADLDGDGFLWIRGRVDDAIIRGGFKIDPGEVQRAIEAHPAVREAAVVGRPDDRLGAVPVAAVQLQPGAAVSAQELLAHARRHLAGYQVPVEVRVVAALPRTPSLKVRRPGVAELFE